MIISQHSFSLCFKSRTIIFWTPLHFKDTEDIDNKRILEGTGIRRVLKGVVLGPLSFPYVSKVGKYLFGRLCT